LREILELTITAKSDGAIRSGSLRKMVALPDSVTEYIATGDIAGAVQHCNLEFSQHSDKAFSAKLFTDFYYLSFFDLVEVKQR
jgi:hypothetical protein